MGVSFFFLFFLVKDSDVQIRALALYRLIVTLVIRRLIIYTRSIFNELKRTSVVRCLWFTVPSVDRRGMISGYFILLQLRPGSRLGDNQITSTLMMLINTNGHRLAQ